MSSLEFFIVLLFSKAGGLVAILLLALVASVLFGLPLIGFYAAEWIKRLRQRFQQKDQ